MNKNVSNKITAFNFFFTICILIYHSNSLNGYNIVFNDINDENSLNLFLSFSNHLGFIAMSSFLIISAFLFYYNISNSKQAIQKMKRRLQTLLIPYLFWSIVVIIFNTIMNHRVPFSSLKSFINIMFFAPINGSLWYMFALLILMLPSPLIVNLKNRKKLSTLCLLISFFLLLKYQVPTIISENWWWYKDMVYYLPAYLIGIWLALNFSDKIINEHYNKKICSFVSGFVLICIILLLIFAFKTIKLYAYYIYALEFIMIWLLLPCELFNDNFSIYKSSFVIYVIHQPILIVIFDKIFVSLIGNNYIYGYEMLSIKLAQILLIIGLCYLFRLLIKKFLPEKMVKIIF